MFAPPAQKDLTQARKRYILKILKEGVHEMTKFEEFAIHHAEVLRRSTLDYTEGYIGMYTELGDQYGLYVDWKDTTAETSKQVPFIGDVVKDDKAYIALLEKFVYMLAKEKGDDI